MVPPVCLERPLNTTVSERSPQEWNQINPRIIAGLDILTNLKAHFEQITLFLSYLSIIQEKP